MKMVSPRCNCSRIDAICSAANVAVDPMEADARHRRLAEPARQAIARSGEAGMPRPDPYCWRFQACDLEGMKR